MASLYQCMLVDEVFSGSLQACSVDVHALGLQITQWTRAKGTNQTPFSRDPVK